MGFKVRVRLLISAFILFLLPARFGCFPLALFGHRISPRARVGFSIIIAERLVLECNAKIGHLNLISVRRIVLRQKAVIGYLNVMRGPVSLWLNEAASFGNRNVVARARRGVTYGASLLRLGQGTKITAGHKIDCAASVRFGAYSILAGAGSQLWTHGYVHAESGPERYRVDGDIRVGDNVYIGSRVIITGGVRIASGILIGAGLTVASSLTDPGMYVSAPMRRLLRPPDPRSRSDLMEVEDSCVVEAVFRKRNEVN